MLQNWGPPDCRVTIRVTSQHPKARRHENACASFLRKLKMKAHRTGTTTFYSMGTRDIDCEFSVDSLRNIPNTYMATHSYYKKIYCLSFTNMVQTANVVNIRTMGGF